MVVCCQPSFHQRFQILTGGLAVHPEPRTRGRGAVSATTCTRNNRGDGGRPEHKGGTRLAKPERGLELTAAPLCRAGWLAWSGQRGVHQAANLSGQSQRSGIEFGRGSVIALVILVWGAKAFNDKIAGPWIQTLSQNNGEQRVDQTFKHHGAEKLAHRAEAISPSCFYVAFHCLTIGTVQAPLCACVCLFRESCE